MKRNKWVLRLSRALLSVATAAAADKEETAITDAISLIKRATQNKDSRNEAADDADEDPAEGAGGEADGASAAAAYEE